MTIEQELRDLNAPQDIIGAGRVVDAAVKAKVEIPRRFIRAIIEWRMAHHGQDRYGK